MVLWYYGIMVSRNLLKKGHTAIAVWPFFDLFYHAFI